MARKKSEYKPVYIRLIKSDYDSFAAMAAKRYLKVATLVRKLIIEELERDAANRDKKYLSEGVREIKTRTDV